MVVLTWNLFHGRARPSAGRDLQDEFTAMLAGWEWDVALLQECPPWWPEPLARAAQAEARLALTHRNSLPWARRWLATRFPDLMKSSGGGCNAILVRGRIRRHEQRELRRRPLQRVAHGVELEGGGWVVNLHASAHEPDRAAADLALAARSALAWAGDAPIVVGGDLNLRRPAIAGFRHVAARDVDHVLARGFEPVGSAQRLERGSLSDHPPLAVRLRASTR